jgi:hypothetical protein
MISSSNIDLSTSTIDDDLNRLSLLRISAKARRILDLPIADLTSDDEQYSTNRHQRSITKQGLLLIILSVLLCSTNYWIMYE